MKIDSGSLAFNININGKVGGTPSWGTAIVYQTGDNKIKEDIAKDILIGMIYKKIDCTSKELSLPLGKGGKIYHGDEDFNTNGAPSVPYLAAKFENTYVNGKFVGKPFILLVMKDGYDAHNGRLQLKYSPKIAWGQYKNQEFFDEVFNILGIPSSAPLIYYSIDVLDQDKLHFRCIFKEDEYTFIDAKEYNDFLKQTINVDEQVEVVLNKTHNDNLSIQQIHYGAPGTGKSHIVKKQTEGESVVRTTFHPDSDYSTFVGCYKPTTKPCPMYTSYGEKAVTIKDATGKELTENRIVYEFVDQAFLQAYIKAWKFYAQATEGSDPKKQYLIIEEINRGNCAQIFGDLFQLLDRNGRGFSDYYIHADNDLKRHIYQKFQDNGVTFSEYHQKAIDAVYPKEEESVALRVLSGEILLLPNNLYIWATMNTSDQSLFPIDSAFKRRWDWKYRPIAKGRDEDGKELKWRIAADTKEYDWWSFLEKINAVIGSTTSSEDKKLGFFFCKAIDGVISAETFVSKIIFYLWNDVFKDFGFDEDIFKDEISTDGTYSTLDFDKFYTATANGETIVRKVKVEKFLENLKVEEATNVPDNAGREDEDGNTGSSRTRDYTKYSINGVGKYGKNPLASECVKEYVKLHPELSAEEVVANWKSLGNIVPHFIESEEEHNARTDNSVRSIKIECRGELIYVENNGYGNNGKVDILINAINQKDWGIKVGKIE